MYIFKSEKHEYVNLSSQLIISVVKDLKNQMSFFKSKSVEANNALNQYLELASILGINLSSLSIHDESFIEDFLELLAEASKSYYEHKGYSATSIIEKYKFFDKTFWSNYKAIQRLYKELTIEEYFSSIVKRTNYDYGLGLLEKLKVFLIDNNHVENNTVLELLIEKHVEDIKTDWKIASDASLEFGSMYHNMKEELAKNSEYIKNTVTNKKFKSINKKDVIEKLITEKSSMTYSFINMFKKYQIIDMLALVEAGTLENYSLMLNQDLLNHLPDGYYSEFLVSMDNRNINNKHYPDLFIKGQIDKLYIETDPVTKVRYVDIGDYKTNKKIDKKGMFLRALGETQKMKGILDFMDDCNYNHYTIQLCIYAYMLEQAGFTIRNIWFENFDTVHDISYNKDLIEIILKDINFNTKEVLKNNDDFIDMLD